MSEADEIARLQAEVDRLRTERDFILLDRSRQIAALEDAIIVVANYLRAWQIVDMSKMFPRVRPFLEDVCRTVLADTEAIGRENTWVDKT